MHAGEEAIQEVVTLREQLQEARQQQKQQRASGEVEREQGLELQRLRQQLEEARIMDSEKQDTIRQIRQISRSTSTQLNEKLKELQGLQEVVSKLQVSSSK